MHKIFGKDEDRPLTEQVHELNENLKSIINTTQLEDEDSPVT